MSDLTQRNGAVLLEAEVVHGSLSARWGDRARRAPGRRPAAVYEVGTTPDEINTSLIEPNTPVVLRASNDPNGRVAQSSPPPPGPEEMAWTTPPRTFEQPGRHLVICTTQARFVEANING